MVAKLIRMTLAVPLLAILFIVFLVDLLLEVLADRRSAGPAGR